MKFAIFELSASVDIRPLPCAWVAELLGVILGVQDHKKIKFLLRVYSSMAAKTFGCCVKEKLEHLNASRVGLGLNRVKNIF